MRTKKSRCPPESTNAMFTATPISRALVTAFSILRLASFISREDGAATVDPLSQLCAGVLASVTDFACGTEFRNCGVQYPEHFQTLGIPLDLLATCHGELASQYSGRKSGGSRANRTS